MAEALRSQPIKKRWRAWLRAVHRDFGYLAVGFTVIYAVSGIAQNHIEDWGDVSYTRPSARSTIAPITETDRRRRRDRASSRAAGLGAADRRRLRAGDELRLDYPSGAKVDRDRPAGHGPDAASGARSSARRELAAHGARQEGVEVHRRRLRGVAALPRDLAASS